MQSIQDLVQGYINSTQLCNLIRNRIKTNLSQYEHPTSPYIDQKSLNEVIKGNHHLIRSDPDTVKLEFDFCPIVVVIYGEIQVKGKKIYKGEYYEHGIEQAEERDNPEQNLFSFQVNYLKATTLVVINKEVFNHRITKVSEKIYKQILIQLILPTKILKIDKTQVKQLARVLTLHKISQKYSFVTQQKGIFLLVTGIFQILHKMNPVLEIQKNFIEIRDEKQFTLRLKNIQGMYCYLPSEKMKEIISQQSHKILGQLWDQRQKVKQNKRIYTQYKDERQKVKEKYRQNLKKNGWKPLSNNTISFDFRSEKQNEQNKTARINFFNKCATPVTTSRSLSTPKMRKTSQSWSTRYEKKVQSYSTELQFEQKYERTIQESKEKLQRIKSYQKLKGYDKLTKEMWLDSDQLQQGQKKTYLQIKTDYSKAEGTIMKNFKRLIHIHSNKKIKYQNYIRSHKKTFG